MLTAGLSIHNPDERAALLEILAKCEQRTGWPIKPLRHDLESEWRALEEAEEDTQIYE
jgi:hypothetical protein